MRGVMAMAEQPDLDDPDLLQTGKSFTGGTAPLPIPPIAHLLPAACSPDRWNAV